MIQYNSFNKAIKVHIQFLSSYQNVLIFKKIVDLQNILLLQNILIIGNILN